MTPLWEKGDRPQNLGRREIGLKKFREKGDGGPMAPLWEREIGLKN